jgi:hypothetical protein
MRTLVLVVLLAAAGCSGSSATLPPAPSYSPEAMADAALQQFDTNHNGTIEGAELDACPALKGALADIDKNKDKALSRDELVERFTAYKNRGANAIGVGCVVKLNGQMLSGASVKFVPEECMKGSIRGGTGTSDASGNVKLVLDGGDYMPGLQCGLYKIVVSKSGPGGEELPAKYNTQTTLGREVCTAGRGGGNNIELNLTK